MSMKNITNGFRACGIVPLNPNAIPQSSYDPSKPTDTELRETVTDISAYVVSPSETVLEPASPSFPTSNSTDLLQDVVDISDPQQLLELISSGDFLVEDISIPENFTQAINNTADDSQSLAESQSINETSSVSSENQAADTIETCAASLFLPPVLETRPSAKKRKSTTSHKILTSQAILEQKTEKEKSRIEKETKRARKIKTEK